MSSIFPLIDNSPFSTIDLSFSVTSSTVILSKTEVSMLFNICEIPPFSFTLFLWFSGKVLESNFAPSSCCSFLSKSFGKPAMFLREPIISPIVVIFISPPSTVIFHSPD